MAEVLLEFSDPVSTEDGDLYAARACGSQMPGGIWQGWIEFLPLGEGAPMRSSRETTQPNRQDTIYWATGLTPVYLEGSLRRTMEGPIPAQVHFVKSSIPLFDTPAPSIEHETANEPAVSILNPFSVYRKGEALLRRQLSALSSWHLVNIIRAHRLSDEDPARLAARHPASLVELIVDRIRRHRTGA